MNARLFWAAAAVALTTFSLSLAQSTTANISGIVRDGTGAAVPGTRITATNVLTSFSRTVISDDVGNYLITNLPIGEYSVTSEKEGFRRSTQTGITLAVEQNARVDVTLAVGSVSESVTVTAQVADVDTRSAVIGEMVDRARIQELPLNGRNAMELARVVPGILSVSAPPAVTNARNGPMIVAAGGRDTSNEFRLDGTSNKNLTQNTALNLPSPDALQEFRVLTSNFSAEYGRYTGAVFIAVTRAGTNQFHASMWEYLRNKALNARSFFSATKPDLKQNQFGFTAGGPIIRNRTFFFGSYQGLRIRETQLFATAIPPTAAERRGDFSASARAPIDPVTGQAFPGAQIPATRIDPVAAQLLQRYVPLPNSSDGRWVQLVARPTNGDQYLGRVDHNFSSRNNASLRYFRDETENFFQSGNISPYAPNRRALTVTNWALQDTHTFSHTLLNEFRIGVNRVDSKVFVLESTQLSDLGANFPGVITPQLPTINVTGYFSLGTSDVFGEDGSIYQIGNTTRWFKGRHSISIGGEFERTDMFNRGSSANQGVFSFDASVTRNAFADFLIGKPRSLDQASPYERLVRGYDWYAFIQDDVRVSRRLSANLGVRYQFFKPYGSVYDRTNTYHAGQQSKMVPTAPLGLVFPGDAGVPRGLVEADKNNFSPRAGLAWDALGNGKLSIRAAYGLYYEDHRSDLWTYPAVNQPFVIREFVNNPFSLQDPYRGRVNPFPYIYTNESAKFSFPMGLLTVIAPRITNPYVHQMSFSIEQALPSSMVLKVAYVGKLSHNLLRMVQKNPAVYIPGQSTTANTDQRRPLLPGVYARFREIATNANASYHSMQASLSRRFSNGLTFMTSYTLGKFIDEYSAQNLGQTPQDPYNYRADRSLSDDDRRHVFNGSFVYELPFLRTSKHIAARVIGGWSLSGLVSIGSGEPVYVTTGQDASLTGVNFDRPDLVGQPKRSHANREDMIQQFFNTSAFVANRPGMYGTAGRNLFSGPASNSTNLALTKSFPISERLGRVQFRSEFFNAFNQVNFGKPEARLNNRNFGRILTAGEPRIIQFALRYQF